MELHSADVSAVETQRAPIFMFLNIYITFMHLPDTFIKATYKEYQTAAPDDARWRNKGAKGETQVYIGVLR